jgi:hypothetical protein
LVEDCHVELPGKEEGAGHPFSGSEFAYNAHNTVDSVFRRNIAVGGQRGFNNDSAPNNGLTLAFNTFDPAHGTNYLATCYGINLEWATTWSQVYSNTLTVGAAGSQAIRISGTGVDKLLCEEIAVHNNKINITPTWNPSYGQAWGVNLEPNWDAAANVHVENNQIDERLANLIPGVPTSIGYDMSNSNLLNTVLLGPSQGFPLQPNPGWTFSPYRADFAHDTYTDILLQSVWPDTSVHMAAWSMNVQNPVGTERPMPWLQPGYTWRIVGTADFDLDGQTDVFFQDSSGWLGAWLFYGHGLKAYAAVSPNFSGNWRVVGIADFNHDGQPDLLFQTSDNASLGVWYMNGTTQAGTAPILSPPSGIWHVVGTGDFNGDGNTDLLWQVDDPYNYPPDSQLGVWLKPLDPVNIDGHLLTPEYPSNRNMRVVATGDYNADGKTDIFFQNRTNGELRVWCMGSYNQLLGEYVVPRDSSGQSVVAPK